MAFFEEAEWRFLKNMAPLDYYFEIKPKRAVLIRPAKMTPLERVRGYHFTTNLEEHGKGCSPGKLHEFVSFPW